MMNAKSQGPPMAVTYVLKAPVLRLKISARLSQSEAERRDRTAGDVKVLHTFSRFPKLRGGTYWLQQLTPDRRYALVRLSEPTARKSGVLPGWANTYFLVDLSTGKTRVFLKDETERQTLRSISTVRWVTGP